RGSRAWPASAAVLLIVLALVAWGAYSLTKPRATGGDVGPIRSVAVMTFTTEANDGAAAAVAQGLPEDLGTALAATGFRVASRSAVAEMGAAANARAGSTLG